eukprot:TRINITY_DN66477_c8_g8_i1.p1 TRINITY_DN66477_c8_g8~~TRINITY_DN66477_c8_g8_i1.p1  ORF type:complete len:844 (+),score=383.96 TRINITY_DN66477_c8_g8_i1:201-2534(+)
MIVGLVHMQLPRRLRYIVENVEELTPGIAQQAMDLLLRMARHSPACGARLASAPTDILPMLTRVFANATSIARLPEPHFVDLAAALCASSRPVAKLVVSSGAWAELHKIILLAAEAAEDDDVDERTVAVGSRCLHMWRVLLSYGLSTNEYVTLYPAVLKLTRGASSVLARAALNVWEAMCYAVSDIEANSRDALFADEARKITWNHVAQHADELMNMVRFTDVKDWLRSGGIVHCIAAYFVGESRFLGNKQLCPDERRAHLKQVVLKRLLQFADVFHPILTLKHHDDDDDDQLDCVVGCLRVMRALLQWPLRHRPDAVKRAEMLRPFVEHVLEPLCAERSVSVRTRWATMQAVECLHAYWMDVRQRDLLGPGAASDARPQLLRVWRSAVRACGAFSTQSYLAPVAVRLSTAIVHNAKYHVLLRHEFNECKDSDIEAHEDINKAALPANALAAAFSKYARTRCPMPWAEAVAVNEHVPFDVQSLWMPDIGGASQHVALSPISTLMQLMSPSTFVDNTAAIGVRQRMLALLRLATMLLTSWPAATRQDATLLIHHVMQVFAHPLGASVFLDAPLHKWLERVLHRAWRAGQGGALLSRRNQLVWFHDMGVPLLDAVEDVVQMFLAESMGDELFSRVVLSLLTTHAGEDVVGDAQIEARVQQLRRALGTSVAAFENEISQSAAAARLVAIRPCVESARLLTIVPAADAFGSYDSVAESDKDLLDAYARMLALIGADDDGDDGESALRCLLVHHLRQRVARDDAYGRRLARQVDGMLLSTSK